MTADETQIYILTNLRSDEVRRIESKSIWQYLNVKKTEKSILDQNAKELTRQIYENALKSRLDLASIRAGLLEAKSFQSYYLTACLWENDRYWAAVSCEVRFKGHSQANKCSFAT